MANRKTTLALLLALAACSRGTSGGSQDAGGTTPAIERADEPIPYQYLVVLKPGTEPVAAVAESLLASTEASTLRTYERALRGFAMHASEETALAVARDPRVARVSEDGRVHAQALTAQADAPAGLDRIDQRTGTDGDFSYHDVAGARVHAYVLDTGILASHSEFLGRPPDQVDFVREGQPGDCNGHGTHVAGILGGTTFGVAKHASLHSLRVLGCDAAGATSDLVAALDWLVANAQTPAVVNLSLGRGADATLDAAVEAVVAAGIPVVVAAGDARRDACATSPARTPGALTVGSTDGAGVSAASFSNFGPCVDLFAPGVDVRSAAIGAIPGDLTSGGSLLQSGTSASAPFVAGAVALYLGRYTGATPAEVEAALVANSTRAPSTILPRTPGALPTTLRYTPDRFLFTTFVDDDNSADAAAPVVSIDAPLAGATVSGDAVQVSATASDDVGVTRVELFANGRFIASAAAAPYAFTWDSRREPGGAATLVARAYDQAGHVTASAAVTVTVLNDGIARFDPALGVPRCDAEAHACDSVGLLAGRAELGPEENAPNTLPYACGTGTDPTAVCICADGPFGLYQLDESIEQIKVIREDSTGNLAVGADVRVEVTVFIGSVAYDALDLYSAPSAAAPIWRLLGTLEPKASGAQLLTGRFTLPEGGIQAVRASLRYGGFPMACTDGGFDERDDLAFVVASGTPDGSVPTDVAVTAPRPDDKVEGTIPVTATATDDHFVSRVEFTVGTALIGTDDEFPWLVRWNSGLVPNGTYEFKAIAVDGAGNVTESAPVKVQVKDETHPLVTIQSPKNGDQLATTPIVVKVAATDNGVVKKVELEVDGTVVATSSTPIDPAKGVYEFPWGDVPRPTKYQLVAIAYDGSGVDGVGNSMRSDAVSIGIGDATPPTCRIKAPAAPGLVVPVDPTIVVGNVFLEAEALDDTEVTEVSFFQVGSPTDVALGSAKSAPFAVYWESGLLLNGNYDFYCVAKDSTGNLSADDRLIRLTAADTKAPTAAITSPPVTLVLGAVVPTPVTGLITIEADAADDGAVQYVELYVDGVYLLTDSQPPYTFTWDSSAELDLHTLTAKAYDYNGHSTVSDPLTVDSRDATPPTVTISYPLAGAELDGVVPIRAEVVDTGGAIAKVELLEGTTILQTLTEPPYTFSLSTSALGPGGHTLQVKATDVGAGEGAASVAVTVVPTGAVYDGARGVPVCEETGERCHSSALLDGRDGQGPELNAPNTLGASCLDGALGTYHVDESIDFISVRGPSGSNLTAGSQAELSVTAWIFSPAEDQVALFYAADARDPVWIALPPPTITGSGQRTFTTTFTLPDGDLQAVRASIRYAPGETGACVIGDFNDTDDLVFKVVTAPDTTPPTVAIVSPTDGQVVTGLVTIAAAAADARGISYVEFLVGGTVEGTDYSAPYTWTWNTAKREGGTFTLTARAVDSSGNSQTSASVTVKVKGLVELTAPLADESVQGTVTLAANALDVDGIARVEFRVGPDAVATATTAPYQASWNSASVLDGRVSVVARMYDAGNAYTDSAPVTILVSNTGNASWDNAFKVPACGSVATKCFTGSLVNGRGPLGPEPDAPNTLGAACADGTQGTYHLDESIDAITLRSAVSFTAGGSATIEVKVWATQDYVMDSLDLYGAADASAPVWEPIATLKPTRAGAQILSAPYLLPSGSRQAIRAQLRYGGEATFVCGGGTFDDRDDLVFTVGP